jgi:lipopolysaccharide/colanic/teichoic acid biosynthesis glycosyltransferase
LHATFLIFKRDKLSADVFTPMKNFLPHLYFLGASRPAPVQQEPDMAQRASSTEQHPSKTVLKISSGPRGHQARKMESSTAPPPQPQAASHVEAPQFDTPPSDHPANLERARGHSLDATLKRTIDVIVSLALIVVLLPLLAIIALAVRFDSRGPALFRQRRLGRDMEPLTVLKFRTMAVDSSSEIHQRYIAQLAHSQAENGAAASNGNGGAVAATNGEMKKLTADPRVTSVGRILRRTSLDELPQLFNVVTGSMSLIGPRPALEYELEHYRPVHYKRFDVRPGITGLWQVSGRNRLGFHEMLDLDVQYSEEASLALDVGIILRTPMAAFRHAA